MTDESLIRKDFERNCSGITVVHFLNLAGGTEENDENPLPLNSSYPCQD
jgi:hypothetical protein